MVSSILLYCAMVLALQSAPASATPTGTRCPTAPKRYTETCVCDAPGGIIDLTTIANYDGTPRFTNLKDPNDYSYSYNPCKPFTVNNSSSCKDVYACQVSATDPTLSFGLADAGTEEMWIDTDGTPYLYYTGSEGREVRVFLNCDHSVKAPIATTTGDSKILLSYEINITSCQVCPGGCKNPPRIPLPNIPILCPPIPGEPSCMCQHPDGIIDLTPYANVSGKAMFTLVDGTGTTLYYNPCQTFQTNRCWNTHICIVTSNSTQLAVTNSGSERIYIDSGSREVYIQYTGPSEIESRVYLICDHSVKQDLPALGIEPDSTNTSLLKLTLTSCRTCPGGCKL